jgi:hypothetical protein
MNPQTDCPKWAACSAAVCPIEPDWHKHRMLDDEATCYYSSESVKDGAQARFKAAGLGELHAALAVVLPQVMERWPRIRRTIERAAFSGSRMDRQPPGGRGDA